MHGWRRGQTFHIELNDINKCVEKECRLFVVRCDDFYKDYNPSKMTNCNLHLLPIPPLIKYSWDIYEIKVPKAQADKKTEFNFTDRKYIDYGP